MQLLMQKALGVSPSQYWGKLFQMLLSEINQKHMLTYFHDESTQLAAESFNMAGRIMTGENIASTLKYQEEMGGTIYTSTTVIWLELSQICL